MKHSIELSHYRRANVWLDEAPPAEFTAVSVVTRLVLPKVAIAASRRVAGVELLIPHGPGVSYCLIGAELIDAAVDGLELDVSVNNMGVPFHTSLASTSDQVRVGLLDEYAGAVTRGAASVVESLGSPTSAALRFRWAAHGLVGSSEAVFEKASAIVLRLLLNTGSSVDQLAALLG